MTVGELIEELRKLPQHHPIFCEAYRYPESIRCVGSAPGDSVGGPRIIINTVSDPRNDPDRDDNLDIYGPEL